jgi:predicted dehydrogenase
MFYQSNILWRYRMEKPDKKSASNYRTSRRSFLQTTAVAGAAVTAPMFIPAKTLGRGNATGPNDKIILGGIGIGGRGSYDLKNFILEEDVHFVATCDPQRSRAKKVKAFVDERYGNNDVKIYHNMFEFLEKRSDVDVVLSTTGDRWHATAAVHAMRAGKDIYSEKPSSMTVAEGQAVVETAKQYGRIYQTGAQRLSEAPFTFCNEMLRLGRLGELKEVRAHIAPWNPAKMRHDWLPEEKLPSIEECDWDHWLGPCP